MTREKAIDKMEFCKLAYQRMIDENSQEGVFVGKGFEGKWKADTPLYKVYEDMRDACDMSIKALEQEPCEDAISRQAVQDYIAKYLSQYLYDDVREAVEVIDEYIGELPPVNPQPKTGHWIPVFERLPDDEVEVLIYTTDKEINKAYRRIKEWTIDRMVWVVFETLGYGYIYDDDEVLAWMPLPEPYEQQESEEV